MDNTIKNKLLLSSSLTYFWKFIFPVKWVILCCLIIYLIVTSTEIPFFLPLVGIYLIMSLIVIYFAISSKKVWIDDEFLYVDNFKKTIKIPLNQIKKITDNTFLTPRTITIKLNKDCEFGDTIHFIAYTKRFLFYTQHPAHKELKNRLLNYIKRNRM